jgi:hypothetical protein
MRIVGNSKTLVTVFFSKANTHLKTTNLKKNKEIKMKTITIGRVESVKDLKVGDIITSGRRLGVVIIRPHRQAVVRWVDREFHTLFCVKWNLQIVNKDPFSKKENLPESNLYEDEMEKYRVNSARRTLQLRKDPSGEIRNRLDRERVRFTVVETFGNPGLTVKGLWKVGEIDPIGNPSLIAKFQEPNVDGGLNSWLKQSTEERDEETRDRLEAKAYQARNASR